MVTIHNAAKIDEIAPSVLMPGDPVRAEYIAKNFLTDAKCVSNIRRICAYTGRYGDKRISVMASGMGASSMGIYSWELFHFYNVSSIIRVGSAGGLHPALRLGDIVVGLASSTDTGYAKQFKLPGAFAPAADYSLIEKGVAYAGKNNISVKVGTLFSGEAFYYSDETFKKWSSMGILAVEMESAALYMNAAHAGKKAVVLCTISDLLLTGEAYSPSERENSFNDMISMALSMAE